ncbi:type I-E CRISPR-associated protein Cas5/CasD [Streptomyces sp. NBC_00102]|uniref:type I-E CRISPR-associated protein Cas5/CasD n=1 Tax=Streptomyces sp. NBC_00102 TaxID=2975652 RepID=UPI002259BFB6|nr:type I-E CRISPR-associated protein Cas5/CasD [Streptomyces sp. NBC_00102]MCX5395683.1 type I-E CRISPR-associated protein Cas5/CasD [Streptomyces sp. NBC_00102]
MTGFVMHISAAQQSWGGPADFKVRPTHTAPTRSGLTGLLASALGRPRKHDNSDLAELRYVIRVDRPGHREMDFHTIGGGYHRELTAPTAAGTRKKDGEGTMLTERWYLADAAFTVAVTGPTHITALAAHALTEPVFAPYLGRRSCPPDSPLLLRTGLDDPVAELDRAPLHADPPPHAATIDVTFVHDTPRSPGLPATTTVRDVPSPGRTFTTRDLWESRRTLPASLCAGRGTPWITALTAYAQPTALPETS